MPAPGLSRRLASAAGTAYLDVAVDRPHPHLAATAAHRAAGTHVAARSALTVVPAVGGLARELPGHVDARGTAEALGVGGLEVEAAGEAGGQHQHHAAD